MTFNNQYKNLKPYQAHNMFINEFELHNEAPAEKLPHTKDEIGYINVAVYTASGALPVQDAVVTLYHFHDNNELHILYHLFTDKSGMVPNMEVPVVHTNLGEQYQYYYSTYNLRVQKPGYYTVNVLDVQAYPGLSTNFKIHLTPLALDEPSNVFDKTIIIPPKTNFPSLQ